MSPGMDAQKRRNRFILFVGLSLLVHLMLLVGVREMQLGSKLTIPDNTVFVDLDKLPLDQITPEQEKPRQIVESERAEQQVPPKDSKYLGEHDQTVAQESKAKQIDSFRKGGKPSVAGSGSQASSALKKLAPPSAKPITPPTQAEIDGFREAQKKVARQEYSGGGEAGAQDPGSATNDYLKDVKDGERTLLNTKEFVYFGYYRRIREKLEVAWNSKLRATLGSYMYGGRNLATDRNYVTGVIVVLDRTGKITAVKVLQKSGAHDLDDAAVGAFNDAGPFPDPPAGLVDKNGRIEIRWDFILQS